LRSSTIRKDQAKTRPTTRNDARETCPMGFLLSRFNTRLKFNVFIADLELLRNYEILTTQKVGGHIYASLATVKRQRWANVGLLR